MAPIVFFDGVCGLCNAIVDSVMRFDRAGVLKFAPLQGKTAKRHLAKISGKDLTTIVYLDESGIYTESDAIIRLVLRTGNWFCRLIYLAYLVPRSIRNYIYRYIAKRRYGWFGKRDQCRVPTPEEADRMLD